MFDLDRQSPPVTGIQRDAAVASLLACDSSRPAVLLHSGRHHQTWATKSYLAVPDSFSMLWETDHGLVSQTLSPDGRVLEEHTVVSPWDWLRNLMARRQWLIGYLGYGLGRWAEAVQAGSARDRSWPLIMLASCRQPPECISCLPEDSPEAIEPPELPGWVGEAVVDALGWSRWAVSLSDHDFAQSVRRAAEYIAAGDIYQVNLTRRWTGHFKSQLPAGLLSRLLYARLAGSALPWFGGYLALPGSPHRAICSASPELFLDLDHSGLVHTRPIKGTRPATIHAGDLADSIKDTAELNMIVDLMRNDLGRVAAPGSVKVVESRGIESHPTVHHGVATVQARLRPNLDAVDLLLATFPGGSITGAPKIRAMEIIEELEPVARGPYCGSLAVFRPDGSVTLSIAIRTMMLTAVGQDNDLDRRLGGAGNADAPGEPSRNERSGPDSQAPCRNDLTLLAADYHAGCGIVADSDPAMEVDESLDKARILRNMLPE